MRSEKRRLHGEAASEAVLKSIRVLRLLHSNYAWQAKENKDIINMYYYVYILRSTKFPKETYIGFTSDLKKRIKKHNEGGSPHTSKYKPWEIKTAISFTDKEKAMKFEKYFKSHSGRAFAVKHF